MNPEKLVENSAYYGMIEYGQLLALANTLLLEILFVEKECSIEILSQVFRRNPKGITLKLVAMGLMEAPTE